MIKNLFRRQVIQDYDYNVSPLLTESTTDVTMSTSIDSSNLIITVTTPTTGGGTGIVYLSPKAFTPNNVDMYMVIKTNSVISDLVPIMGFFLDATTTPHSGVYITHNASGKIAVFQNGVEIKSTDKVFTPDTDLIIRLSILSSGTKGELWLGSYASNDYSSYGYITDFTISQIITSGSLAVGLTGTLASKTGTIYCDMLCCESNRNPF